MVVCTEIVLCKTLVQSHFQCKGVCYRDQGHYEYYTEDNSVLCDV